LQWANIHLPMTTNPGAAAPRPADHGREGGMATRENAPELTEPDRDDQSSDRQ
jgi:hypothetical protein